MSDIIARIDSHLSECEAAKCQELEPDAEPLLRDCRDEIIAARACAEMMLQGTGQRIAENMAERVMNGMTVWAWIPVADRLPDAGVRVLIFRPLAESNEVAASVLRHEGMWRMDDGEVYGETEPTHWMPLPAPPADAK